MSKRIRQYVGILAAVAAYYVVHEGAHLLVALHYGVFRKINILGLGVQIDVYADQMTGMQLGIFCLAGSVATLVFAWALVLAAKRICRAKSKVFKAVMWYMTLAALLLDPLYLSVLCGFFGGGDMNGIALLVPETVARAAFACIGIFHCAVIWKYLWRMYTESFGEC